MYNTPTTGVDGTDLQELRPEGGSDQPRPRRGRRRGAGGRDVPLRRLVPQALQGRHPLAPGHEARGALTTSNSRTAARLVFPRYYLCW